HYRTRLVEETHRPAVAALWPAGAHPPSPFDRAAASELDRRLEVALDGLPESYREVLLLVGVEGLTPSEAACVCGVSADAMRQRLSRARSMLSVRLEELTSGRRTMFKVVLS